MIEGSFLNEVFNTNNYIGDAKKISDKLVIKSTPIVSGNGNVNNGNVNNVNNVVDLVKKDTIVLGNKKVEQFKQEENIGFFDYLFLKKRDMVKTIILVLTVIAALSFHSFFAFWIKSYILISKTKLKIEMLIRLLYPLIVIMVIWFIKAFML